MSKVNARGRSTGEPRHLRLYEWMLKSEAWRSLDVYEKALYVEFKARYNGANNGGIPFSGKEMEAKLNCSNRPADRALRGLIEKGFIKVAQKGSFNWKVGNDGHARATTYIITEYSIDLPVRNPMPATKEFMKWRADKEKSRGDEVTRMAGLRHPIKGEMGGSDTRIEVSASLHDAQKITDDGVRRASSNNIPYTPSDPVPSDERLFSTWISRNIPDRSRHREAFRLLSERKMTPEALRRLAA